MIALLLLTLQDPRPVDEVRRLVEKGDLEGAARIVDARPECAEPLIRALSSAGRKEEALDRLGRQLLPTLSSVPARYELLLRWAAALDVASIRSDLARAAAAEAALGPKDDPSAAIARLRSLGDSYFVRRAACLAADRGRTEEAWTLLASLEDAAMDRIRLAAGAGWKDRCRAAGLDALASGRVPAAEVVRAAAGSGLESELAEAALAKAATAAEAARIVVVAPALLDAALARWPSDPTLKLLRADSLAKAGKLEEAEAALAGMGREEAGAFWLAREKPDRAWPHALASASEAPSAARLAFLGAVYARAPGAERRREALDLLRSDAFPESLAAERWGLAADLDSAADAAKWLESALASAEDGALLAMLDRPAVRARDGSCRDMALKILGRIRSEDLRERGRRLLQ